MLKRIAVAVVLISAVLAGLWIWRKPPPVFAPAENQRAQLLSTFTWVEEADWFGGFSGIELSADGQNFIAITDRGRIVSADLVRENDILKSANLVEDAPLLDSDGVPVVHPRTDAEGLAVSPSGQINVSFEGVDRVWQYSSFKAAAKWASYWVGWRALAKNGGMEALAIDEAGTLWATAEISGRGASSTLVYTKRPNEKWRQTYVLPLSNRFRPVGADFGPDGRLFLLERGVYPFGFRSRVRALSLSEKGVKSQETVLETALGRHDNLEGISVWLDEKGSTRLTLISDDNFMPFQRTEIVEYILR